MEKQPANFEQEEELEIEKAIGAFEIPKEVKNFEGDRDALRDYLFKTFMDRQLIDDYMSDLRGHLEDDVVADFAESLLQIPEEQAYSVLSLPKTLREKTFEKMADEIDKGAAPEEVLKNYVTRMSRYKFGIGFHTSKADIREPEEGSGEEWFIKGTERDHRDNDLPMAYYSQKFRYIYDQKHPHYIYVVRTDPDTHKTDGNWCRAGSLSIVMRVPYDAVFSFINETAADIQKENSSQRESEAA